MVLKEHTLFSLAYEQFSRTDHKLKANMLLADMIYNKK
jgi:hypothetical protein